MRIMKIMRNNEDNEENKDDVVYNEENWLSTSKFLPICLWVLTNFSDVRELFSIFAL